MRSCIRPYALALVALATSVSNAWATPVTLTNPGFEDDAATDPDGFNEFKTGWGTPFSGFGERLSGSLDYGGDNAGPVFAGEDNYLLLRVAGTNGGAAGGVSIVDGSQAVPTTIMANMRYTLSVDVAHAIGAAFPTPPVDDTFNNFTAAQVLVRVFNIAGGNIGLGQTAGVTMVIDAPLVAEGTKERWTITYDTDAAPANLGGGLAIQLFLQTNDAGGPLEALFDDVELDVSPIVDADADFDGDDDVDGEDFLIWQRGLGGPATPATGNANGDAVVDGADLVIWRDQFGQGGGSTANASTIPEPSSFALLSLSGLALASIRRKLRS